MSTRTGILVANKITKGVTGLNYGTHSADEGIGGLFSVANYAAIASIPAAQVVDGMIVIAQDDHNQWQYQGSSWVNITPTTAGGDTASLHLDQGTPQTVVNGAPIFDHGLRSNGDIIIKAGDKLYLDG